MQQKIGFWLPAFSALGLGMAACGTAGSDGTPKAEVDMKAATLATGESSNASLPADRIQEIVGAQGEVSHGVLDINVGREDIGDVQGPLQVTFTPAFEIHGDLYFQPLSDGRALLNGDMAVLTEETNPFIAALQDNGLVFQAFHQHLVDLSPAVWFIHFRGVDDPLTLARAIRAALQVTATPLPQSSPKDPTTPLDTERLASILGGDATVEDEGVVSVTVDRKDSVQLDGVTAQPESGISTLIEFKPLDGSNAAVVPDFSLTGHETQPVILHMQHDLSWFQGCLYNQETDETPQLYFDHMLKVGDAYELAGEIRSGLDLTNSKSSH